MAGNTSKCCGRSSTVVDDLFLIWVTRQSLSSIPSSDGSLEETRNTHRSLFQVFVLPSGTQRRFRFLVIWRVGRLFVGENVEYERTM